MILLLLLPGLVLRAHKEEFSKQKQLAVDTSLAEWMMKQDSDSLAAEEMETMKLVQQLADEEEAERRKIEEVEEEEVRRIMEEEERRINGVVECGICFQEFWRGEEMVQCQEVSCTFFLIHTPLSLSIQPPSFLPNLSRSLQAIRSNNPKLMSLIPHRVISSVPHVLH